jgi:hypothetical protein
MATEKIPAVNYSGDVPCACCGSMTFCEKCADDSKVVEEMHRLLWLSNDDPNEHHIHLCEYCPLCTFDSSLPDGGERCMDDDEAKEYYKEKTHEQQ